MDGRVDGGWAGDWWSAFATKGRSTCHGGPIEACHGCFDAILHVGLAYVLHIRHESKATIDCSVLQQVAKVDIRLKTNIAFLQCGGPTSELPCASALHQAAHSASSQPRQQLAPAQKLLASRLDQQLIPLAAFTNIADGAGEIHRLQVARFHDLGPTVWQPKIKSADCTTSNAGTSIAPIETRASTSCSIL